MLILEPNIVWDHTQGFDVVLKKDVEAKVTPGERTGLLSHNGCQCTHISVA